MLARLALVVLAVLALGGAEASPAAGASKRAKAERALEKVREARGEALTPALRELFVRRAALSEADRGTADAYFARPTDADNRDGDAEVDAQYRVPEATPLCSARFCIHYVRTTEDAPNVTADADGDTFPDYVERMLEVFEFVADRENADLGWPAAQPDGGRGGGPELDVYIADIGDQGIYGYASPDGQQDDGDDKLHAYQVMDDDYAEFGPATDASLRVTAAHEYNHVLQFGINAGLVGNWAYEATATWMEEQVYPGVDDYFQYIEEWAKSAGLPLTTFQERGGYQYGSAVWNIFLSSRFGQQVVRDTWTTSLPGDDALTAYDRVIPGGFATAFGAFAAAVAEWKADTRTFPDGPAFFDVTRSLSQLPVDGAPATQVLDHTSFQLLDVTARTAGPIRLEATFPDGVAGEIALVGGPGSGGGAKKEVVGNAPDGGVVSVDFEDPAAYPRVTAVLANASGDLDDAAVTARVITRPAPAPPVPDPGPGATPTPSPGPSASPTPVPTPPAVDTTGPAVVIPSSNRSLRASRTGRVRFALGPMRENTTGVISLKSDTRVRVGSRRRILSFGTANFQALTGQKLAAKIRLSKAARRVLRVRRKLRIQATLTVRDASGNATTRTYRFTLRAPKRR